MLLFKKKFHTYFSIDKIHFRFNRYTLSSSKSTNLIIFSIKAFKLQKLYLTFLKQT